MSNTITPITADTETIAGRLVQLLQDAPVFHMGGVTATTLLKNDLGIDSLDRIELVYMIEEEYQLSIPTKDYEPWKTVGDVIRYLEEQTVEAFI